MSDFLSKLTSYNIFNYLLPGTIFVWFCRLFGVFSFSLDSIIIEFFFYYFAGMTISRIGSIIIEPVFVWLGLVRYAPYSDYLRAVQADPQIEILLEANNTYRTIVAMFVCILLAAGTATVVAWLDVPAIVMGLAITAVMIVLYASAFRKQTAYIRSRVEHQREK